MKIPAFRCDECGELVEKASNVLDLEKKTDRGNTYKLEIRFFQLKHPESGGEERGKSVDLCEHCRKFISGAGQVNV